MEGLIEINDVVELDKVSDNISDNETKTPVSINSLNVENEVNNNKENDDNEENGEQIENEEENNIEVINTTNIPEVEAQPLNFFNTSIPITMEQYMSMQNSIRNIQQNGNEEENEIEKYYICNCIPCNKETSCIDKSCEFCICICCPLNLGCKICGLSIISILSISVLIEKTFCPDLGKVVFGLNDLISLRCPLSIIEYCCKRDENNEHNE